MKNKISKISLYAFIGLAAPFAAQAVQVGQTPVPPPPRVLVPALPATSSRIQCNSQTSANVISSITIFNADSSVSSTTVLANPGFTDLRRFNAHVIGSGGAAYKNMGGPLASGNTFPTIAGYLFYNIAANPRPASTLPPPPPPSGGPIPSTTSEDYFLYFGGVTSVPFNTTFSGYASTLNSDANPGWQTLSCLKTSIQTSCASVSCPAPAAGCHYNSIPSSGGSCGVYCGPQTCSVPLN